MTERNTDPTRRFTGLAETYALHRPTYPPEAVDFIIRQCELKTGETIVDVGCGTGISTRLFAERGFRTIGIEPNGDMRQKAIDTPCPRCSLPPEYVNAQAESTGLADASADAVICAQAFHWFDPPRALVEFRRILKPGRWLALVWNERDESDAFTRAYGDIIRTAPDAVAQETRRGAAGNGLLESELFLQRQQRAFRNTQLVDLNGLLGRAFSASYAPKDEAGMNDWQRALAKLFGHSQRGGVVRIAYETAVYLGQRNSDDSRCA